MTRSEALEAIRSAALAAAAAGELPSLLADLEGVRTEALLAAGGLNSRAEGPSTPSRILTVREAAERLGRSRWWVYRHKSSLPVTRFQTGGIGFDQRALDKWIKNRTS